MTCDRPKGDLERRLTVAATDREPTVRASMATSKQRSAAQKNVKKAAAAGKRKRTIAKLPKKTRTVLGKEGAKAAKRKRRRG